MEIKLEPTDGKRPQGMTLIPWNKTRLQSASDDNNNEL